MILSRAQVREVDRRAIEDLGMSGLVLMENAGRGCVDVLAQLGTRGPVAVCCYKGNNGGDGFVMARHLALRDIAARVLLWCDPRELRGDAAANYEILVRSGSSPVVFAPRHDPARLARELEGVEWIVDALLGTGAEGEPRPPLDEVIDALNAHPVRKLAVDVPSGLDCDTGRPARPTFRADHTCTFVAEKPGFSSPTAAPFVGRVRVVDIGVPRNFIDRVAAASA
jgi:NAD(P)H-hydrate epimerase